MEARKITALTLLTKIKRQALDEAAGALGRLRAEIAALDDERAALHESLRAQGQIRDIEVLRYLPGYIRSVRAEEARLTARRATLADTLEQAEARVRACFHDHEAHDRARNQAVEEAHSDEARRAAAKNDEQALHRWLRQRRRSWPNTEPDGSPSARD